jgi:site-specific DNA-methyltransferase (adenine-specific)
MNCYKTDLLDLRCMDCMDLMREMPDGSVDAVITDPPYFRVVDDAWDRAWKCEADFLAWVKTLLIEWRRVLKFNGSLYCFAYPDMAGKIETLMAEHFTVLNHIVWVKPSGYWDKQCKEAQRQFFPQTERILFAEQKGADYMAKGESTYAAAMNQAREHVFAPIRAHLLEQREKSGLSNADILLLSSTSHTHYWAKSQWALPTEKDYKAFRDACGGKAFCKPYEELRKDYEELRKDYEELRKDYEELRKDYEELRKDYEELRRPFHMHGQKHSTDVWSFKTEPAEPGRHPCQKPLSLMRHIIETSTRPGSLILDSFMGSGSTAIVAAQMGRRCISSELDPDYFTAAVKRVQAETAQQEFSL